MCGIAGIVALTPNSYSPSREALGRMAGALLHRGPDELGMYRDNRAGLAHARLSIIDLSTGQQPMTDETETIWIVFNGEIFNYLELRQELIGLGQVFRTHSDTEVILNAYRAWGEAAFERFNGQWALALWDRQAQRLVLSRDRLGICPLYLCQHGGYLYFASEVKAIFAANADIPRSIDPLGIAQTFTFWTVIPPQSVFQGVAELEPGHVRAYHNCTVVDRAYWTAQYPIPGKADTQFQGSVEDAVREVRSALEKATALRMQRADVPVGSYLSGGLDSSYVAALGRQYAGNQFQTFSLRFEDAEYDETPFQRIMVDELASTHHEIIVSHRDIAEAFPKVIYHTERPTLRTAAAPLFLLSKLVRDRGIKVVLTGEGADEIFGGYDIFREAKVRRFWGKQPQSNWRHRLLDRLYPYLARSPVSQKAMARQFFGRNIEAHAAPGFAHDTRWHTTSSIKRLLSHDVQAATANRDIVREFIDSLPAQFSKWGRLAQDQHIEIRTLLSGYLLSSQGDRMLMAHSVEGRFPFLDKDVVALADSLPETYKLKVLDEKHVVKRAAASVIPRAVWERKKQPYRAPDALSFVGRDAPDYIDEVCSDSALRDANIFDPTTAAQLLFKCRSRANGGQLSNTDNMALVGVLSTQLLHHHFVTAQPTSNPPLEFRTNIDKTSSTSGN